jgi:hypothetical protein
MVRVGARRRMVNELAPGLKTIPLTCVSPSGATNLVLEVAKVAMSFGPFGDVAGVQLVGVLQFPVAGRAPQVALPAMLLPFVARRKMTMTATGRKAHARGRRND